MMGILLFSLLLMRQAGEPWMLRVEAALASAASPAHAEEIADLVEKLLEEGQLSAEKTMDEDETDTEYTEEIIFWNREDPADPAEGYIHQVLYAAVPKEPLRGQRSIGASLTGLSGTLYGYLRQDISEAAAGTRTSTVFVYETERLRDQVTFTAEDLNVDAICVDGVLTQEAKDAARMLFKSYSSVSIIYALLADCPYDLYWYNKAVGGGCRVASALQCIADSEETVTVRGYVKFSFAVSQEYALADYEIDPAYGQSASEAAENARIIVNSYEDLSDYDRLLAYKNEICALTSYNAAAAGNKDTPYGNPWQLVWVFDGDPETNVVCEGYAKAFQYLNELSAGDTVVISPQGYMNGQAHMWNIVKMDDGKNYLVDVTNCDDGTAGYPDKLFLAGCENGGVTEGYRFSVGENSFLYAYQSNIVYPETDLKIVPWDYAAGGPPAPSFQALETEVFEREALHFEYVDNGFAYDRMIAEIMYEPFEGEMNTVQETVETDGQQPWEWQTEDYGPGAYSIHFAGIRDDVQSAWSDELSFSILDFHAYVPAYAFSAPKGYVGWQAAVMLEDEADGVLIQETGEEIPCDGKIALIPLQEAGNMTRTLAILRDGTASAFGETWEAVIEELPESGVLSIPDGIQTIEEEAFQSIGAARMFLPAGVIDIGPYAFADNPELLLVEIGEPQIAEHAFEGCPEMVFGVRDPAWGFENALPFLTYIEEEQEPEAEE